MEGKTPPVRDRVKDFLKNEVNRKKIYNIKEEDNLKNSEKISMISDIPRIITYLNRDSFVHELNEFKPIFMKAKALSTSLSF